jgi:hypothetical protein
MGALDRLPVVWVATIAGAFGLLIVPILGLGLAGGLPIRDGWIMLGILLLYVALVGATIGFVFPRRWWLGALAGWPLTPMAFPVLIALGAAYLASRGAILASTSPPTTDD